MPECETGHLHGLAAKQRKGNFHKVELAFKDEKGAAEANRCMGCDVRFTAGRMVAPPADKPAEVIT